MSKFFKGLGSLAKKSRIPELKEERNLLEAEKIEQEGALVAEKARVALVKPLIGSMQSSLLANEATVQELQALFKTSGFVPVSQIDELAQITDSHMLTYNLLYNELLLTNTKLRDTLASVGASEVAGLETRIADLTVQIAKFNDELKKLRDLV